MYNVSTSHSGLSHTYQEQKGEAYTLHVESTYVRYTHVHVRMRDVRMTNTHTYIHTHTHTHTQTQNHLII